MARARFAEQSAPSTPSSGYGTLWPDSTSPQWFTKDDAGRVWGRSHNAAVAAQGAGFASDTYVTGSNILIPSFGLQTKTVFRWTISASKTAAGVATPVYTIRTGANASTADTSRLVLTGPAQTAAVDTAVIELTVTVRTVSATGVIQGTVSLAHNLAATGFANNASAIVEGTSAGFDNSALGGLYIGLSVNGGASASWTLTQALAEAAW
jgi:hypothetical protein